MQCVVTKSGWSASQFPDILKCQTFSNVETENDLMGAEPGKGREGSRQVPMVCLGFLNRSSGTVEQIAASGMPVESRKNLAIVELRNAPHPYTP